MPTRRQPLLCPCPLDALVVEHPANFTDLGKMVASEGQAGDRTPWGQETTLETYIKTNMAQFVPKNEHVNPKLALFGWGLGGYTGKISPP